MKNTSHIQTIRPSPTALLNPCIDVIFKALFTQNTDDSNEALKSFISGVLGKEVTSAQLLPEEPSILDARDKAVRFDVSCTFNDGLSADIEMQRKNEDYAFSKRTEYLSSRLLVHAFSSGGDWKEVKPVFQISIVDFYINKKSNDIENWYIMQEKKTHHKLDEIINIIFLELPKMKKLFNEQPVEKLSKIQKWCKFFVDADDPAKQTEVTKLAETEAGIMKAMTTLSKISNDDIMWKKQLDRDIALSDYNTMMANMKRAKEAAKKADEYERKIKEAAKVIAKAEEAAKTIAKAEEAAKTIAKAEEAAKTIAKAEEAAKTIAKAEEAAKTIAKAEEAAKVIAKAEEAAKTIAKAEEAAKTIAKAEKAAKKTDEYERKIKEAEKVIAQSKTVKKELYNMQAEKQSQHEQLNSLQEETQLKQEQLNSIQKESQLKQDQLNSIQAELKAAQDKLAALRKHGA